MATDQFTTITYAASPDKVISIAGNFNDWKPSELHYNTQSGRFESKVHNTSDCSGKYHFKFIVDGNWVVNQDYATEFDDFGNENNVLTYDFSNNQALKADDQVKREVTRTNQLEPETPNPTPQNLSNQTTNTEATITKIPVIEPSTDEPVVAAKLPEIITGTKKSVQPEKYGLTQTNALTEVTTPSLQLPAAELRPQIPRQTNDGGLSGSKILEPTGGSLNEPVESHLESDESIGAISSGASRRSESVPQYGLGFVATVLHLITSFFRRWFVGGST